MSDNEKIKKLKKKKTIPSEQDTLNKSTNKKKHEKTIKKLKIKMFFVLSHGNHGKPTDWNAIKDELYTTFGSKILLLISSSNTHDTHEGIEIGGKNLACEVATFLLESLQVGIDNVAEHQYSQYLLAKSEKLDKKTNSSADLRANKAIKIEESEEGEENEPESQKSTKKSKSKQQTEKTNLNDEISNENTFNFKELSYLLHLVQDKSKLNKGIEIEEILEKNAKKCNDFLYQSIPHSRIPVTFIGHSLGGLYIRNAIGWLYEYNLFCHIDWVNDIKSQLVSHIVHHHNNNNNNNDNNINDDDDNNNIEKNKEKKKKKGKKELTNSSEINKSHHKSNNKNNEIIFIEDNNKKEKEKGILIGVSYISLCTPHMGSRRPGGSATRNIMKKIVHTVLNNANGLTGFELLLEDHLYHSSKLRKSSNADLSSSLRNSSHSNLNNNSNNNNNNDNNDNNSDNQNDKKKKKKNNNKDENKDNDNNKNNNNNNNNIEESEETRAPLLIRMSEGNSRYIKGLNLFRSKTLVGVTHYDIMVAYCSAMILGKNLFHDQPNSLPFFAVALKSGFEENLNELIENYEIDRVQEKYFAEKKEKKLKKKKKDNHEEDNDNNDDIDEGDDVDNNNKLSNIPNKFLFFY